MSKIPFSYELRPAKQIERKIIIEILNELRLLNYPISSYRYIGMPSITYYDFILFHKYLYIADMIGFESRPILKRMKFNRPYDFIKIKSGDFSAEYRKSHFDKKSIVWLDYEKSILKSHLEDIGDIASTHLKSKSIIIITSPVDYKGDNEEWLNSLQERLDDLGSYLIYDPIEIPNFKAISNKNLFKITYRAIKAKLNESLIATKNELLPLFNIIYNDGGCPMCSAGFLIDIPDNLKEVEKMFTKSKNPVFTTVEEGFHIDVPNFTLKERRMLDQSSKKIERGVNAGKKVGEIIGFEITLNEYQKYIKYARHYPSYQEGIV